MHWLFSPNYVTWILYYHWSHSIVTDDLVTRRCLYISIQTIWTFPHNCFVQFVPLKKSEFVHQWAEETQQWCVLFAVELEGFVCNAVFNQHITRPLLSTLHEDSMVIVSQLLGTTAFFMPCKVRVTGLRDRIGPESSMLNAYCCTQQWWHCHVMYTITYGHVWVFVHIDTSERTRDRRAGEFLTLNWFCTRGWKIFVKILFSLLKSRWSHNSHSTTTQIKLFFVLDFPSFDTSTFPKQHQYLIFHQYNSRHGPHL